MPLQQEDEIFPNFVETSRKKKPEHFLFASKGKHRRMNNWKTPKMPKCFQFWSCLFEGMSKRAAMSDVRSKTLHCSQQEMIEVTFGLEMRRQWFGPRIESISSQIVTFQARGPGQAYLLQSPLIRFVEQGKPDARKVALHFSAVFSRRMSRLDLIAPPASITRN